MFIAVTASTDITEVDENIMKGTFYLAGITYSLMPKHKSMVPFGTDRIPIIDRSKSPTFRSITKWIKKRTND